MGDETNRKKPDKSNNKSSFRGGEEPHRTTVAFFALNRQWHFTYLDRQSESLLAKKAEELLGKCLWDEFPELLADSALQKEFYRSVKEGVAITFEAQFPPSRGHLFEFRIFPSTSGLSVYLLNHRSEEYLRETESEKKYRILIEQASDGIHTYDFQGNFIETNSKLCEMLGYTAEELLRLNVKDLVPEEDLKTNPIRFDELRGGRTLMNERRLVRKDGTILIVEISGRMIEDGLLQAIIRDITERKNAEIRLRQSEERLRAIFETSHDGILVEENERIIDVNQSYLKLFGYDKAQELIGQHISTVISTRDAKRVLEFGRNRLTSRQTPSKYEFAGRRKDDSSIELEASVSVSKVGSSTFITTIIRDISERKRTERLIEAQKQSLEMVVKGAPLPDVLNYLTQVVEKQGEGMAVASILLLDENGHLHNGASPSLSPDYVMSIDGIKADPNTGTCSAAAASGKTVITPDIAADPKWRELYDLPLEQGLQACWTMPIVARDGRVLGTFGTYFRERRSPTAIERKVVEILCRTAALAIERKQTEEMLSKSASQLRRSHEELEIRVQERTRELEAVNEERVEALRQLVTVQEDERQRIARDLHDQLGQQLTALRLKLEILRKTCAGNNDLSKQVGEAQKVARELDSDVDFLAWQLRPTTLDELGIVAALDNYVRQWSAHFNTPAEFNADRFGKIQLAREAETNLYRIAQEALNNVSKYARAKRVNVFLEPCDPFAVLIVEDDGTGFDPESRESGENGHRGMGIAGMRERASLIGGMLEIESSRGTGTTVYVSVPILDVNGENKR